MKKPAAAPFSLSPGGPHHAHTPLYRIYIRLRMDYPSGSSAVCAFIPYEVLPQSSAQWLLGRPPRHGTAVCGGAAFSLLNDSLHWFPHFAILTFNFHCLLRASTVTHTRKTHRREQREGCRAHADIQCFVRSFVETLYDRRKVRGCSFPAVCSYLRPPSSQSHIFFSSCSSSWTLEPHFIEWYKWRFTFIAKSVNSLSAHRKRDGPTSMTGDVCMPLFVLYSRWMVEMLPCSSKIRKYSSGCWG